MSTVAPSLTELDERGVAWIGGTKVKVIEVALDKLAHGSSPEEMHFQYPHLSLAQIHAALSYYYEHQAEPEPRSSGAGRGSMNWPRAGPTPRSGGGF